MTIRIGLDLDGVLYPWHESIYRHFREFKGYEGSEQEFWDYFKTLSESTQKYYVSVPMFYLDTTPKEDVLITLPKLAERWELFYITSRPPELNRTTLKFFQIYDLPFRENLIFSKEKATEVRLHRIDFFLEDLPYHVDSLKGITDVYLMKCPHNIHQREGYKCVNSLGQFYRILRGLETI